MALFGVLLVSLRDSTTRRNKCVKHARELQHFLKNTVKFNLGLPW